MKTKWIHTHKYLTYSKYTISFYFCLHIWLTNLLLWLRPFFIQTHVCSFITKIFEIIDNSALSHLPFSPLFTTFFLLLKILLKSFQWTWSCPVHWLIFILHLKAFDIALIILASKILIKICFQGILSSWAFILPHHYPFLISFAGSSASAWPQRAGTVWSCFFLTILIPNMIWPVPQFQITPAC